MDESKEQVKALAPAPSFYSDQQIIKEDDRDRPLHHQIHVRKFWQSKRIKCFGCILALFLILFLILLILSLTLFHVKNPEINFTSISIQRPGSDLTNLTLVASVSVKNPNVASFRYGNTTMKVYYGGSEIGSGRIPPGVAKARRTMRMNLTVDFETEKIAVPSLARDVISGALNVSTYTRVSGRVKIIGIVKKHVEVTMNCTLTYNISSMAVQNEACKRRVKI